MQDLLIEHDAQISLLAISSRANGGENVGNETGHRRVRGCRVPDENRYKEILSRAVGMPAPHLKVDPRGLGDQTNTAKTSFENNLPRCDRTQAIIVDLDKSSHGQAVEVIE
jgi:hypothetical protein